RLRARMTQAQLAAALGKRSQGNVSDLERNRYLPSLETVLAICRYFKVSLDWFLTGEERDSRRSQPVDPAFGRRLREALRQKGLEPADAAAALDMDPAELQDLLQGTVPDPYRLLALARLTGTNMEWLLTGKVAGSEPARPDGLDPSRGRYRRALARFVAAVASLPVPVLRGLADGEITMEEVLDPAIWKQLDLD
ncbi:MAG: helix-turn-helix transcriptional regulator, partial [Desulfotomaculales bacterium]